jgi:inosine-uridine nucleoside N-ribohydrolase
MDGRSRRVVLDTDIGSDVDDALALGMLLGSPEVELVGVTTVYGDTELRARLARRLIGLAGADVPCHAGAQETLAGRPVWWAGHEGALFADLEAERVAPRPGADFLVDAARRTGDLDVIAIGPLTNIAAAIKAGAEFRHLTVMGGSFTADQPEHNFRSDPEAARIVFTSGIPATVCGLEITEQVRITPAGLARIAAAGTLGAALAAEVDQYWKFSGRQYNTPHDPVAALALLRPDLFETAPVDVAVSVEEPAGLSVATSAPASPVRVVTAIDAAAVGEEILARICGQSGSEWRSRSAN